MTDAAVPDPSERPIIAFFDVDNTLLRGASIFHLGYGAWRHGIISIRDIALFGWQQLRFLRVGENKNHLEIAKERGLGLATGHSVQEVVELANDIYDRVLSRKLWPETVEIAREHMKKGHEVWLITATPQFVAEVIAERLGFTGALGTVAEEIDGMFSGRLVGPVMHGKEKAEAAGILVAEKDAVLADCWAYSDSSNDIPLLTLVGNRVVVNPDASLSRHAKTEDWAVLRLKPASIRDARRRVRRDARVVRKQEPGAKKKRQA